MFAFIADQGIDKHALQLLDETAIKELVPKVGERLKFLEKWKKEVSLTVNRDATEVATVLDEYTCFKCLQVIKGDIKVFFFHLKHSHCIHERSQTKLSCRQGNCKSIFFRLSSFKRHLQSHQKKKIVAAEQQSICEQNEVPYSNAMVEGSGTSCDNEVDQAASSDDQMEDDYELQAENCVTMADLEELSAVFVAKLKANTSIPCSFVNEVIFEVEDIIHHTVNYIKGKFDSFVQQLPLLSMEGTPDLNKIKEELYEDFQKLSNSLKDYSTEYKRNEYFRQKGILLLPEEKLLGHSLVPGVHRGTGTARQEQRRDTFQYIPIGKVLTAYLQQPGVMKSLPHQPESRDLSSFRDGYIYNETWKGNKEKPVIPLLMYVDDFETANPLGLH